MRHLCLLIAVFVWLPLGISAEGTPEVCPSQVISSEGLSSEVLTSDTIVRRAFEEQLGVTFTDNNSVVLIHTGREKFNAMFAAIRQARNFIHLEYFNFRNDSIGLALFDLLAEKAREGVEVRAMFDGFGNSSNDSPLRERHLRKFREAGIKVAEFDPMRFPWINHAYHRDHRKIVVIDGAVAYAGGMNVADYYIHGRPDYGEFRDMHMELTGDVVAQYQAIFARMWWQQTGSSYRACAPPKNSGCWTTPAPRRAGNS